MNCLVSGLCMKCLLNNTVYLTVYLKQIASMIAIKTLLQSDIRIYSSFFVRDVQIIVYFV